MKLSRNPVWNASVDRFWARDSVFVSTSRADWLSRRLRNNRNCVRWDTVKLRSLAHLFYCVEPFTLDGSRQTVAIYGIVSPLFVAMTLVTNCLVCVVLLKPTMRTCTNALLVAMAVSDTMTGVYHRHHQLAMICTVFNGIYFVVLQFRYST